MKTQQLNAKIDERAYAVLHELTQKLHTTKAHLTEKAIFLLKEHYDKVETSLDPKQAPDVFLSLLGKSMERYDELYRKLSQ